MKNFLEIYQTEHIKNGLTYSQIREKYNISRGTWDYYIRCKLKLNCDKRKYVCNDNYFDEINTECKAYLLGFLYADGYIASDGRIGIRLNIKDEEIIKLIKSEICPNSTIEYTNNQNFKRSPQCSIRFKSKIIYQRLIYFGFTTNKTETECNILQLIPQDYKKSFIRGFTDGDGSLQMSKHKYGFKIAIAWSNGTKKILEDINIFFKDCCILYDKGTYFTLRCDKQYKAKEIIDYLYKDCKISLNRKKIIAIEIVKYLTNNIELTN